MLTFDSSVILAVASPPGRSVRGVIRLSGEATFDLLRPHVEHTTETQRSQKTSQDYPCGNSSSALPLCPLCLCGESVSRGAFRTRLNLDQLAFPALALISPGPRSYTGENSAELQLPGNPDLLERVIDSLIASGAKRRIAARRAGPGEFTARAYLGGRMSLTQAEGVAATIAAQSDAELRAARLLTSGSLGSLAHQLANDLANALALVEAGIDFTDQEDVVLIAPAALHDRITKLRDTIDAHLRRAVGSESLRAIPWVVLVGRPNAGKSTLFNALLGRERAVVSDVAGTTRDVLAEPLTIATSHGPAEVMLVDLAGLDEDFDALPPPSQGGGQGVGRSSESLQRVQSLNASMQLAARSAIDRAELVLHCVPLDEPRVELRESTSMMVRTKADANLKAPVGSMLNPPPGPHPRTEWEIIVSAHSGRGLDELRNAIAMRLSDRAVSLAADALALQPRHDAALRSARDNLAAAVDLLTPIRTARSLAAPELIAATLRAALDDLAALAGDITPDDVLGRVFATFCIGK